MEWISKISLNRCTHVIFGFAILDPNTNEIAAYDSGNDLESNEPGGGKGAYKRFTGLKNKNPALKTLISIGGINEGSQKYSKATFQIY